MEGSWFSAELVDPMSSRKEGKTEQLHYEATLIGKKDKECHRDESDQVFMCEAMDCATARAGERAGDSLRA